MKKIFAAIIDGKLVGDFTTTNLKKIIKGKAKRLVTRLTFVESGEDDFANSRFDLTLQKEGNPQTGEGYTYTATANNGREGRNKKTGTLTFTTTSLNGGTFELTLAGASATAQNIQPALSEGAFNQALTANNGKLEGTVENLWPNDFVTAANEKTPLVVKLKGGSEVLEVNLPKIDKGDTDGTFTAKIETPSAELTFTIDGENVRYVATANVAVGAN
jgi:hypothetical protein